MSIEIKIPNIGESITEVTLAAWLKADGDSVEEEKFFARLSRIRQRWSFLQNLLES